MALCHRPHMQASGAVGSMIGKPSNAGGQAEVGNSDGSASGGGSAGGGVSSVPANGKNEVEGSGADDKDAAYFRKAPPSDLQQNLEWCECVCMNLDAWMPALGRRRQGVSICLHQHCPIWTGALCVMHCSSFAWACRHVRGKVICDGKLDKINAALDKLVKRCLSASMT